MDHASRYLPEPNKTCFRKSAPEGTSHTSQENRRLGTHGFVPRAPEQKAAG